MPSPTVTPAQYAQAGRAIFGRDWVYPMRALLDIRKDVAEQIAVAAAHKRDYDMPEGLREPIRLALEAKRLEVEAALEALGE